MLNKKIMHLFGVKFSIIRVHKNHPWIGISRP